MVVEQHLHLDATTVCRDERVRDRHPVEGVDRDPDDRPAAGVADRLDDLLLDPEVARLAVGVVEERAVGGLPPPLGRDLGGNGGGPALAHEEVTGPDRRCRRAGDQRSAEHQARSDQQRRDLRHGLTFQGCTGLDDSGNG